jgi:hypothetical protein
MLIAIAPTVIGLGLCGIVLFSFHVAPSFFGPVEQPIGGVLNLLGWVSGMLIFAVIGMLIGSILWIILLRPFFSRDELWRWLTFGPQIPALSRFYDHFLNFIYGQTRRD